MNFLKLRGFIVLLIFQQTLLCCVALYAQSPDIRFKSITKEDGLPSNKVLGVVKDKLGFLWIATNNGLCRYDAKGRMKVFKADPEHGRLHSSSIEVIYTDSKGFLWIGTRHGGITKIDVATDTWKTYRHQPGNDNSLAHDEILSIVEDKEGRIWVGTENGVNIFYPKEERFVTFRPDKNDSRALKAKAVLSLLQDKNGRIWVGTWGGGLHLFLPDKNDISKSTFRNFMIPGENNHKIIWEIHQDKEGRYWLGEEFALTYMQVPADASDDVSKQNWDLNLHPYQQVGDHTILQPYSIISDSRGNLWFSSMRGLNLIRKDALPDTNTFLSITSNRPDLTIQNFQSDKNNVFSLSNNIILNLYEDNQELIWISTPKGLNQFNWRTCQFELIRIEEGDFANLSIMTPLGIMFSIAQKPHIYDLKSNTIKEFIPPKNRIGKDGFVNYKKNPDGAICMSSDDGIGIYDIKTNTFIHEFMFEEHREYFDNVFIPAYMLYENKLWVGTSKGLTVFAPQLNQIKNYRSDTEDKHSLTNTAISDFEFDNEGNLWISTWGGISVLSKAQVTQTTLPDKFKFENYETLNVGEEFVSNKIVSLRNTPERMYIATGGGLMSYEYESKKFVDRTNGEYKSWVHSVNNGRENEIWMSTDEGIFNYNVVSETYKIYHSDYGVNDVALSDGRSYKDDEGRLYFTGRNIIVRFKPDELVDNETPPAVFVTDALILNTEEERKFSTINAKEIELQHGDYLLELSFSALNYDSPEKNRYEYKLEGFDEGWRVAKSTEPVVYTNLDAGNYIFKVKAANNDGVWNKEGTSLKIVKKPALWETRFFRVAMILLTILGVLWAVRAYNRRLVSRYKKTTAYNKKLNAEIRERKKAEKSLQEKNNELISINRDLEQFAYICSHDLKEPIRGIYSFSHLIEKKIEHEATKKKITPYLKYVYNYVETLQNIISSLGIFTEINRRKTPTPVPVPVKDIYKRVETSLKEIIKKKNAVVNFTNSTDTHIIHSSEYELALVIENLVQNGIKYNTSDIPQVYINLTNEDKDWLFTVKDNGIGIEEKYHEYIFQPFKTLQNKSRTNSSGLGLAICTKLIARLGGKIWLESTPNEGSTFYVLLEKQAPNEENDEETSKLAARQ